MANSRSGYDLATIGSGSAGFAAMITAGGHGARVAMGEPRPLGAPYVNIGCVPTKTQIRAFEGSRTASHHPLSGMQTRASDIDQTIAQTSRLVYEMIGDIKLVADAATNGNLGTSRFQWRW